MTNVDPGLFVRKQKGRYSVASSDEIMDAARRVVDHRDEGITATSTAPRPFRPGRGGRKIRARQWPRPVFQARNRIGTPPPSRQFRRRR